MSTVKKERNPCAMCRAMQKPNAVAYACGYLDAVAGDPNREERDVIINNLCATHEKMIVKLAESRLKKASAL